MTSRSKGSHVLSLCFFALIIHVASPASIFDIFASSVNSLVTNQEEVQYSLVRNAQEYEERRYPAQKWICKKHTGELTSSAQQQAFMVLFDYLAGENNRTLRMNMAVPASVQAPGSGDEYEACFYPGREQQRNTPYPTNSQLYVKIRPHMTIFTKKFGGYADTEAEWRTATAELIALLEKSGEKIRKDYFFWNAYDSPVKFWSRRNEVWVRKA